MRIAVVGGPLDGLDARAGEVFAWIGVRAEKGTIFSTPAPGRHLYRRVGDTYLHAGDLHWRCPGCGGFMRKVEGGSESIDCQLCGAAPEAAIA